MHNCKLTYEHSNFAKAWLINLEYVIDLTALKLFYIAWWRRMVNYNSG